MTAGAGRRRLPPESMFPAGVDGIRVRRVGLSGPLALRVAEAGWANGRPVLLVHGWGASIYMWRAWFAPLVAAGFHVVAVDLPGHGLSDKPVRAGSYTLDRQVATLRELLVSQQLIGAPVVAQSMGAGIALELAMREPELIGTLVLVNPASFGRVREVRLARLVSPALIGRHVSRLVPRSVVRRIHRRVYGDPSRVHERDVDEYWAALALPGYARAMWRMLHEHEWMRAPVSMMARRLRALVHRPLVLLGTRDRLVRDARPYAAALVREGAPIELREVPGGGHAMNEEYPVEVSKIVMDYLARDHR